MAIAKTRSGKTRLWLWLALIAAALLGGAWIVYGENFRRTAGAGTAYGARVACSCRFVAGRSLGDCSKDKLAGMELIRLSEDAGAKSVTASIPLVASDTAFYREGYGCVLQPYEG
ncbi:MAG: hypothetical protein R3E14_07305 [Erythrobacter sp.]